MASDEEIYETAVRAALAAMGDDEPADQDDMRRRLLMVRAILDEAKRKMAANVRLG